MRQVSVTTGEQEKGRTFRAFVLSMVEADVWDGAKGGGVKAIRPALISLACSPGEAGPLVANLRIGKRAAYWDSEKHTRDVYVELLKSAGYAPPLQQRCEAGVRVDFYLPSLFEVDPGFVDGIETVRFVCLPDRRWLAGQGVDVGRAVAHVVRVGGIRPVVEDRYERSGRPSEAEVAEVVPYAPLFARYLLGRCRLPLVPDIGFLTQVLCACLSEGLARRAWGGHGQWGCEEYSYTGVYRETAVADGGFAPGICFSATRASLERVLSEQTMIYVRGGQ